MEDGHEQGSTGSDSGPLVDPSPPPAYTRAPQPADGHTDQEHDQEYQGPRGGPAPEQEFGGDGL